MGTFGGGGFFWRWRRQRWFMVEGGAGGWNTLNFGKSFNFCGQGNKNAHFTGQGNTSNHKNNKVDGYGNK
eukprot:756482-Karenia_brevis.AAC.1